MAYGSAAISADYAAWLAQDRPLLASISNLSPSAIEWSAAGSFAGADATDASYPAANAYDGAPDPWTQPSSAATTWYLLWDFGAAGITFDLIALMGNLSSLDGVTVTFEIANASTFATDLIQIGAVTPGSSSNARLIDIDLGGNSYNTVRYFRIKMTAGGAFTPKIGELILGRRFQLQWPPNRPYSKRRLVSEVTDRESDNSRITRYKRGRGRRVIEASVPLITLAQLGALTDFWDQTRQGQDPFLYIDAPSSAPEKFHLMYAPGPEPELRVDETGPEDGTWQLRAIEQGPSSYFYRVEAGL